MKLIYSTCGFKSLDDFIENAYEVFKKEYEQDSIKEGRVLTPQEYLIKYYSGLNDPDLYDGDFWIDFGKFIPKLKELRKRVEQEIKSEGDDIYDIQNYNGNFLYNYSIIIAPVVYEVILDLHKQALEKYMYDDIFNIWDWDTNSTTPYRYNKITKKMKEVK